MDFAAHLSAADRATVGILGGPVLYSAAGGVAVEVRGIFDAAYVKTDAGQAGVGGSGPAVFLRLADLPGDPEDDDPTVTVDGKAYRVREVQRDGLGGVLLLLHVRE
jgi:hypothetical protein